MAVKLSNLPIGAKIKEKGSTYYGKDIIFLKIAENHPGYPKNSTTLLSEKIISLKAFDAKEPKNSAYYISEYGNNRYIRSNIKQWLNSSASSWYRAQHSDDEPPAGSGVTYNPYDSEKGFMANLTPKLRAAILPTSLQVLKKPGGLESFTDKIFLLSCTEVGLDNTTNYDEGTKFDYFKSNSDRVAYPTKNAIDNNTYTSNGLSTSKGWYWWLRTPVFSSSHSEAVHYVYPDGSRDDSNAYNGYMGVRPALNLDSGILVSDKPDSDGAYVITYNQSPTISGDSSNLGIITEDTKIRFSIDDADGDIVTCEIKIDGVKTKDSPFISELNQTYSIPIILKDHTIGEHTVEVIATDSKGASSNKIWYFERGNSNPTISGRDEDLGDKNVGFDVPFSVDDIDVEDILTVTVTLNNKVIQTINNALRQKEYNTKISDGDVYAQEIGKLNTITIKVDDGKGGVSYRYKYFKRTNTAPIISGNDENLGTISVEPTIKFSAYDLEDDAMTYSIFLNDTALVRDKVLEANKEIIFEVPRNEFAKLINGNISNRLRVVVQDIQKASSVRNYTFKRELKECYHKTTHETDIQATEYFAYVNTLLADGAKLKVLLTNNAFDKTPTWEDATETISEGRTYKFTNKNQTSNKAGVAIKIEIIPGNSTGASWILGYGGGFK